MTHPDHAIRARALRKIYPAQKGAKGMSAPKEALKSIDLEIPVGSIYGLLGPNGAGKSTFINILAGLTVKTSGQVSIWGYDQDQAPRRSRAAIGVVPQELNLDPFFTPYEALEIQAGMYGVPKRERRTEDILDAVGLADKAHAYARTLSGGMRRRLLIAKALAHNPPVLVLDEPTAGVDIELRRHLWAYVRELNARGVTIVLTTHYLEEAEEMCDRIAIINHGEVIVAKEKSELISTLDRKVAVLTFEAPLTKAPEALARLEGVEASLRNDGALALAYGRAGASLDEALVLARETCGPIRDIATEEPHLEEVFVALTSSQG